MSETAVARLMARKPHRIDPADVLTPIPAAAPAWVYWRELDDNDEAAPADRYGWSDGVLPVLAYGVLSDGRGCVMVLPETGPRWITPFSRMDPRYQDAEGLLVVGSVRVYPEPPETGGETPWVWAKVGAKYLGPDALTPGWF